MHPFCLNYRCLASHTADFRSVLHETHGMSQCTPGFNHSSIYQHNWMCLQLLGPHCVPAFLSASCFALDIAARSTLQCSAFCAKALKSLSCHVVSFRSLSHSAQTSCWNKCSMAGCSTCTHITSHHITVSAPYSSALAV